MMIKISDKALKQIKKELFDSKESYVRISFAGFG